MSGHDRTSRRWLTGTLEDVSPLQSAWLQRPGALTAGLRQLGLLQLSVLSEHEDQLGHDEAWMLEQPPGHPVWVREIIMHIEDTAVVVARSLTPLAASQAEWAGMRGLATRPLADLLYHDARIVRSAFRAAHLAPSQPLYKTVMRARSGKLTPDDTLLARCSTFWRAGQPLVVEECFLPGFWPLAAQLSVDKARTHSPTKAGPR